MSLNHPSINFTVSFCSASHFLLSFFSPSFSPSTFPLSPCTSLHVCTSPLSGTCVHNTLPSYTLHTSAGACLAPGSTSTQLSYLIFSYSQQAVFESSSVMCCLHPAETQDLLSGSSSSHKSPPSLLI